MPENNKDFVNTRIVSTTVAVAFSAVSLLSTSTIQNMMPRQAVIAPMGNLGIGNYSATKVQNSTLSTLSFAQSSNEIVSTFSTNIEVIKYNPFTLSTLNSILEYEEAVISTIESIKEELPKYLSVKSFFMEEIEDPETGSKVLMLYAVTDMEIEEALKRLEKFNDSWWMDNYNGFICVDVIAV